MRAGKGQGQFVQGLVGIGEDLGFYPEGGRNPGGLWAEEAQSRPGPGSISHGIPTITQQRKPSLALFSG